MDTKHCISITLAVLLAFCSSRAACRIVYEKSAANSTVIGEAAAKFARIRNAKAELTINGFQKGESGGGPSECDGKFHPDDTPVVALSTPWYADGQRCFRSITIRGPNGNSATARVVDECDVAHAHCKPNIVDASKAVWEALKVPRNQWGLMAVTWSDD
ncbi:unnamed protein product [Linum tenue]|uniref:Uncharacterized protein n=1 Tax=Linum tenue TaxID=586396 RepID=A0AAV0I2X3_9ROSI|nr:unnamed protein product [Linum tenue]